MPAPTRGEFIRKFGEALRAQKPKVSERITKEAKKIISEGEGETQEVIDMCDFATGLSRQLYGLTMPSERPDHRLQEIWQPLGIVGCVTAFNFPVAVFGWNFCLAAVCGNSIIWKPSPHAEGCADLVKKIWDEVADEHKDLVLIKKGGNEAAIELAEDEGIALFSATGSCDMGKALAPKVAKRLGRSLLELGGNNAIIISKDADLEMAIRATVFGAVGTCGQRCTSTRRLIVHEEVYDKVKDRLVSIYQRITIGDPLEPGTLVGPMIDQAAVDAMQNALEKAQNEGGSLIYGGQLIEREGNYVTPAIIEAENDYEIVQEETFAPILYLLKYNSQEEAIAMHNGVRQGLSSAMFTLNLREAERFLSVTGSDCGIANINIGTSGAEIGGAFGGEKETGGGRESGSDAWKAYMRRQTNTINWGDTLPLAQGISFDVD